MNIALIFAGGIGTRFGIGDMPKQFMKVNGVEILIHTLSVFESIDEIDEIILVSVPEWIPFCKEIIKKNSISKVRSIVSGGETGQLSIFNGLKNASENYEKDSLVLIHDGVRPLINSEVIKKNIVLAQKKGNAITVSPAIETVITTKDSKIDKLIDRSQCMHAKAPQTFILEDIYNAHLRAQEEGILNFIDSASMMNYYGFELNTILGNSENIKVTTNIDYYILKGILSEELE